MCSDRTGEKASGFQNDFDGAVEACRRAILSFLKGDPKPTTEFFSRSDDVTLANPLGPPAPRTGRCRHGDRRDSCPG
jgi:hypothetical protein